VKFMRQVTNTSTSVGSTSARSQYTEKRKREK
jgi:hypothetical protein